MPYTIQDAIRDEIKFLKGLSELEKNCNHGIAATIASMLQDSLIRILSRVEDGKDWDIGKNKDGKMSWYSKQTNRKTLEEEYPALKDAAEKYNLIKNLVDSTPNEEKQ